VKRVSFFVAVTSFVCLFLSSPLLAQVSFFQPPAYAGLGNVFVADFNGDAKPDLLTADGTLNLGNGDGTFKLGTPLSGTPLAVADFNGDGKQDVLEQGTGTLLVLLGNGDGTFQPAVSTASGAALSAVGVADLNGDGHVDVVGVFNGMLIVYLGKGDGTFAPGVSYSMGNTTAGVLTLGDFNGDHKTDVVLSIPGDNAAGQEIVLLGNGDGTFQAAKASVGVANLTYVVAGDFNGDGKADLAISASGVCNGTCTVPASIYILRGNGDGTFQAPTSAITGSGPLAAADLNGDGKLDLFVTSDPTVGQVYLGNGDGTFSNTISYFLAAHQSVVATGDFNSDGKIDLIAGNDVLLGNGNGTFQGVPFGAVPNHPSVAVTGRFDKTGSPGVAVVSNQQIGTTYFYNVYILSNDGKGALSRAHTYALQAPGAGTVTTDINGDGNLDLIVFGSDPTTNNWSYSVLLGNGDGSFQPPVYHPQNTPGSAGPSTIVVADFNGDHKPDIAVGLAGGAGTLALLRGNGDGTFAAPAYFYDGDASYLVSADFNGDGKLDIAAGGVAGTAILYGNGDGTFQAAVFPPSLGGFAVQSSADFNNDGNADLVSTGGVALGKGDGTFTLVPLSVPSNLIYSLDGVADLNGDGKADLLITSSTATGHPTQDGTLLGNGDGTFGSVINVPGAALNDPVAPPSLLTADMNGDGRPDIVFPWLSATNGVVVLLNVSAPGFGLSANTLSPASVTAGNSATSTVTVSPMSGFTGSVTLACLGLPSGASCQFAPAFVPSGSNSSALTVTTTTAATAGTYSIQVHGTAGSLTTTATLSLVVQAAAASDFTIAPPTPATQTITAGQNAKFTLALTPTGSFSGTVNLTCAITPAATPPPTCTLSSASVQITGSGAQSVTATVATTAPTTTRATPPLNLPTPSLPLLWTATLLSLAWLLLRYRKRQPILAPLLLVLASASLAGCGGGSSPSPTPIPGTPSGTYTATVTASSGNSTHATTVQVTVQ
jgi:hypothetical protein